MSGRDFTENEWAQWHREQKAAGGYSDEEWARHRRQNSSSSGNPAHGQASTGTALLPLPEAWKVSLPPRNGPANQPHKPSDLSGLVLTNAVLNQSTANAAIFTEKFKTDDLFLQLTSLASGLDVKFWV